MSVHTRTAEITIQAGRFDRVLLRPPLTGRDHGAERQQSEWTGHLLCIGQETA